MRRKAYALINLPALKNNLAEVKKIAGNSKVMAVVKADAYGHGVLQVCKYLENADAFSVACVNEALNLRENGVTKPILSLQGFAAIDELQSAIDNNIQVVIHQPEQIDLLKSIPIKSDLGVYIKLDSGMHRLGLTSAAFKKALTEVKSILPRTSEINLMTHLACADELDGLVTKQQLDRFDNTVKGEDYPQSIANSAAILTCKPSHRHWVRPGLALYGINPLPLQNDSKIHPHLQAAMSLRAPIIAIKQCKKGAKIGYGGKYCCPHDMEIGIVAVGYADGYPRHFKQTPSVSLHGKRIAIVGRVSMDMISIDLSSVRAEIGDEVELWGSDISVAEVAANAELLSYELLCSAGNLVHRKYIQ